jgi:hypothetical protein
MNLKENIIHSNRNNDKVAYDGYFYNKKEEKDNKIRWRCNKKHCKSYLYTDINYNFITLTEHNHESDEAKYNLVLLNSKLKENVINSDEPIRNIIAKTVNFKPFFNFVPFNYVSTRKTLVRFKNKQNFTYSKDYDIPKELTMTKSRKQFLLYDSGIDDDKRILIFATADNLIHLAYNKIWLCDSTFKSAPIGYEQLFTIQCKIRGKFLPLVHCFMKNRKKESYDIIFNYIKKECQSLDPKYIIIDFEKATYNSLKEKFPGVKLSGCLFHFGQILWRRLQNFGLQNRYKNDFYFKHKIKMIFSLAFVPLPSLTAMFSILDTFLKKENDKDILKFLFWFQINYMEISDNGSPNNPIFWNVYDGIMLKIPRTTNSLEGYHRHLNNIISVKQLTIKQIGVELIRGQLFVENHLIFSLYAKNISNEEDEEYEKMFKTIVKNFEEYYHIDYLFCIALNFKMKFN